MRKLALLRRGDVEEAPLAELPFDDAALEQRLVWILGSPRTGSTWLLRMLIHPWLLTRSPMGVRPPRSFRPPAPAVIPINESHVPNHLTPLSPPAYDPNLEPGTGDFLRNTQRGGDPSYFLSEEYESVWRPELRRLILQRFHAQVERIAGSVRLDDPLVAIKEPNGSHGAEMLMSLLPRSRMIFLFRDGRDVVDSQMDLRLHGRFQGRGRAQGFEKRLSWVLSHSRLWVNRMNAVQAAYESHPPELRAMVRYEDMRADTLAALRPLVDWLGIERTDQELHEAIEAEAFEKIPKGERGLGKGKRAATSGLWRENMTSIEQSLMDEVMGAKLVELGYAD